MKSNNNSSRRAFIRNTVGAFAAFTIVPRHVLGRGYTAPSDQLTKAVIGTGEMGRSHFAYGGTRVVAICDVDKLRLQQAAALLDNNVKTFTDFRDVIQLPEVDIVHIATPPHWHGFITIEAAAAGKDIWCETPMTLSIGEGKKVVEAVQQYGRMFRLNTESRYGEDIKRIKRIVNSGLLGWPLTITLNKSTGFDFTFNWLGKTNLSPVPVPATLNYDRWLGPAPYKPYHPHRVQSFRGYWDYDGGVEQSRLDQAQYILGKDNASPVSVETDAPLQHPDAAGKWRKITFTYEDGCKIVLDSSAEESAFITGSNGKLYADFRSDIPDLDRRLKAFPVPLPILTDFNESVRTRKPLTLNEENGHRSCTLVNMAKIALRLGRSLEFDPVKQQFLYDDGANLLIDPPMRAPWNLPS